MFGLYTASTVAFFIMENEMGDIKYVQLESGEFLSDPDFQLMTSNERGIYCSVIFYMYLNGGKIINDPKRIENLCNVDVNFEKSWKVVQKKFVEKNGYLTHKRVRKELVKAKKFLQHQRKAGLASAAARQSKANGGLTGVQPAVLPSKVKESKVKVSKDKDTKSVRKFVPPSIKDVVQYITENPELSNIDATDFWRGYDDGGWIDTQGKPVRNWKLKLRTRSKYAGKPISGSKQKGQGQGVEASDKAEQLAKGTYIR